MDNSIDKFLIYTIIPIILGIVLSYFIYGWWIHRSFRDKHFKFMQNEMEKQTIYLKILAEKLAGEKLDEIRKQKMEEKKGKIESKKELLLDLTKKVEAMRGSIFANKSERSFRELMIKVSGNGVDATIDKNVAQPGSYQIEVLQLAQKSSAISNGVEDKDNTYVGVGYLQYELPNGDTKEVYIDSDH